MRAHNSYSHPGFMDVVMHVTKVTYRGPKYIKCKVLWFNTRGLMLTSTPELVTVPLKGIQKWRIV